MKGLHLTADLGDCLPASARRGLMTDPEALRLLCAVAVRSVGLVAGGRAVPRLPAARRRHRRRAAGRVASGGAHLARAGRRDHRCLRLQLQRRQLAARSAWSIVDRRVRAGARAGRQLQRGDAAPSISGAAARGRVPAASPSGEGLLEHRVAGQVGVREAQPARPAAPARAARRCRARPARGSPSRGRSASGRCARSLAGRSGCAARSSSTTRRAQAARAARAARARSAARRSAVPVGGQHGRRRHRSQALVHGIDVAEAGAAVDHVVPGRRRAGPVQQRLAQVQVGHQPRRVRSRAAASRSAGGGCVEHARGDEQRQRQHHLPRGPALRSRSRPRPRPAPAPRGAASRRAAPCGRRAAALPSGAASRCTSQALPSGQVKHGVALAFAVVARRVKAVPAGEVVQAGPGRDRARRRRRSRRGSSSRGTSAGARRRGPARRASARRSAASSAACAGRPAARGASAARSRGAACLRPRPRRSGGTAPAWPSPASAGGSRPSCQAPSMNRRSCGLWHRWRSSATVRPSSWRSRPISCSHSRHLARLARRAAAGSARRAGRPCRPARGRGCCRRAASSSSSSCTSSMPAALQRARRRQTGDAGTDDQHRRRARCARRAPAAAAPSRSRWPRSCDGADPAAVASGAAPASRPHRSAADASGAARAERRAQQRPRRSSRAPGPTLPRRCAPAPGSTGGSARPARAPCRAGTAAAPAGPRRQEAQARRQRRRHAASGRRPAMTKPHSPKLGTCAWYGVASGRRPRASPPPSRSSCARSAARWSAPPRSRRPPGAGRAAR